MLNRQYGDPNISRLLQLVVNIVQVEGKLFLFPWLLFIDLRSQNQCVLCSAVELD